MSISLFVLFLQLFVIQVIIRSCIFVMPFPKKKSDQNIKTINVRLMYVNQFDFDNISLNFICSVDTKLRHFTSAEI